MPYSDSDEEAAAAGTVAMADTPTTAPMHSLGLLPAIRQMEADCQRWRRLHAGVPPVVPFLVEGKPFAVSREALEKDPQSVLFVLAEEHFPPPPSSRSRKNVKDRKTPRPSAPICIANRDPLLFRMLLNLLRGYGNAIPPLWRDACEVEAVYYGLKHSWEAKFSAPERFRFRTMDLGDSLSADTVCGIASDYYSHGKHVIDLEIVQSERIGVGVISNLTDASSIDRLKEGHGCAMYWNDGKVTGRFSTQTLMESMFPFPSMATVRIVLDADDRSVRWYLAEDCCVAVQRLPREERFAFAVVAARSSQVRIINS